MPIGGLWIFWFVALGFGLFSSCVEFCLIGLFGVFYLTFYTRFVLFVDFIWFVLLL